MCRVEGAIEGNIGVEAWLPLDWNGRLLAGGVGGPAGQFNYRDMSRRAQEGFATFSTDSGHKKAFERWMSLPKARVDYEHRATHLSTLAVKAVAEAFYGRAPGKAYFLGCSGGGRQGLKEMQQYPGDYDGIIAGAPGPDMPRQSVRMLWFALQAKRSPAGALNDADWDLYEKTAVSQCDGLDGVKDGVIAYPPACRVDISRLACAPGGAAGNGGGTCLSAPKLAMLRQIISPMPDEHGRPMDRGLFAGVRTRPGPPSPLLRQMWADGVYDNPDWNEDTFRRTHDLNAAYRLMPQLAANSTAIGPFVARGAKAIIYQGWADPSTNAGPTLDYYDALTRARGGRAALGQSVRLFMVPGMYHCRGGAGPDAFGGSGHETWPGNPQRDMLWALIDWVEQGRAPDTIIATGQRKAGVGAGAYTRPICAYPMRAEYAGRGGDIWDAASYRCAMPKARSSPWAKGGA
ncbi:tannase/feruloyl esterase family alpha/beta hydrolase [Novosphingobium sp. FSY-8]|uniref:Tannase/feruloyl esterase family alpha/beta hydrolase n=1 Tax=Novosphingobium ovatum TaxID=1908523 RepID=A0ABW9X9Z2_9SPHN|nr:tannase/feruloyl esterase family alpha/beta hydrolase [Novosphingobium ovatum]